MQIIDYSFLCLAWDKKILKEKSLHHEDLVEIPSVLFHMFGNNQNKKEKNTYILKSKFGTPGSFI